MDSFEAVKAALTPALAEVLEIGKASFENLVKDIKTVLSEDRQRPRASIETFVKNFAECSLAAEKAILLGQTEKGERMLKSMSGTLNTYQVIAANKAINEAYAAWRKILTVVMSTIKELGPIIITAVAGPAAGAAAKAVLGEEGEAPPAGTKPSSPDLSVQEAAAEAVVVAQINVADAEANLKTATKSKDKNLITISKSNLTEARGVLAAAEKDLVGATPNA